MSKKLLEENTVRRFMKIAGLRPLTETFVEKMQKDEEPVEEAYNEEELGIEPMKEEAEEEPAGEMEAPEAPEGDEGEVEVDMGAEGAMGEDEKVELLQKLAQALGVDVEVEGDEEMEPEMEEPAGEMGAPETPEADEEEVMEEEKHLDKGSAPQPKKVDDADAKDPNQDPKVKEQDPRSGQGAKHMAESREAFKNRLVEEVSKRVAARLKNLK